MPGALSLTIFILNTSQSGISRVKSKQNIFQAQYISVIRWNLIWGISDLISHAGIQSDLDLLLQDPLINIPLGWVSWDSFIQSGASIGVILTNERPGLCHHWWGTMSRNGPHQVPLSVRYITLEHSYKYGLRQSIKAKSILGFRNVDTEYYKYAIAENLNSF